MASAAVALLAFAWNLVASPWHLHKEQAARLREVERRPDVGRLVELRDQAVHQFLYRDVRNDEELAALQTELRAWEEETFAELEKCAATKSDVSWVRTLGSFPAAVFSDVFNNELAQGGAG